MINNIEDNKESIVNFESNKKILFSESNDEDKNNILNKEKIIETQLIIQKQTSQKKYLI